MHRKEKARKRTEDQWALKRDREFVEKIRAEREARLKELAEQEDANRREELRKSHWLCCPKCGHDMQEKDLFTIKVDVCGYCEGIFFDRGELEEVLVFHQTQNRLSFFRSLLGLGQRTES